MGLLDNMLTGTMPSEVGQMSSVSTFFTENNKLTGPVPSEFGLLSNLGTNAKM